MLSRRDDGTSLRNARTKKHYGKNMLFFPVKSICSEIGTHGTPLHRQGVYALSRASVARVRSSTEGESTSSLKSKSGA